MKSLRRADRRVIAYCALLAWAGSASAATPPPYPPSRVITGVRWDFSGVESLRKAHGSDIWALTWGRDGNLYGAWGDGGGFDGDDNQVGRVSLGFARVTGKPVAGDPASYSGKNVWGAAPAYAEAKATFGGKVSTLLSVGGVLFGHGRLWLQANAITQGDAGTDANTAVWSTDLGRTWQVASWSSNSDLGSFLNFGRDYADAFDGYVYMYYRRAADDTRVYLRRARVSRLLSNPETTSDYQYLESVDRGGRVVAWSAVESRASPVFYDPHRALGPDVVYDAAIRRYLLTAGHADSSEDRDAAAGRVGVFEAPYPWGPWATVAYYDDWGQLGDRATGDFIGLRFPSKWISADGRSLWAVFSNLNEFDSFNVVQATLTLNGDKEKNRNDAAAPL
jgi:hypothetical protein